MSALAAFAEPTYGNVKASIGRAKKSLEQAAEEIVWQIENQAWAVLGYADWNEMREAEYGGAAFMVPKSERPELQARLRREGLTLREIADTSGVGVETVRRDLARSDFPSEKSEPITNARGQQRPASYAPRSLPDVERETAAAVEEFPDLAHYVEQGDTRAARDMAGDLRRYRERGELDERLDTLRRSIAYEKTAASPAPAPVPQHCATCTCNQEN